MFDVLFPFYECFVKCPVDQCEKRDPKGLYKKARTGEITNMTGLTAPYEEPQDPDLIVDTNRIPLNQCVDQLIDFLIVREFTRNNLPRPGLNKHIPFGQRV